MTRTTMTAFVLLFFASITATSEAALLRLDFSGEFQAALPDNGTDFATPYSGYFVFDTETPNGSDSPTTASYFNAVIEGSVLVGNTQYTAGGGLFNDVFIVNDGSSFNDLFALVVDVFDDGGSGATFSLQLGDPTQSIFSGLEIPTMLDLADFGPFAIDDFNGTGAFLVDFAGFGLQGDVDAISLTAVPLPASLWFMLAGLVALRGLARSR